MSAEICILLVFIQLFVLSDGACTFPDTLRGVWTSSEKGALEFTADTIVDYPMPVTVSVQSITFVCELTSGDRYLLKSQSPFQLFQFSFSAYICLELHTVSDYKYWYQVLNDVDPSNFERVYAQPAVVSVTLDEGCNRTLPVEDATFNVLIKDGAVGAGLVEATCPDSLFHTFSAGTISSADGSTTCDNTTLDVCTDRTQMIHTYGDTCDASLKFSTEGLFICLYDITDAATDITYLHIWNNDTTLASGHVRIICYAFARVGTSVAATVYPGACQAEQTTSSVTSPGVVVEYNAITQSCAPTTTTTTTTTTTVATTTGEVEETGPQADYTVTIILGCVIFLLLVLLMILIIWKTKCRCLIRLCKKREMARIGHSDEAILEGGMDTDAFYRHARTEAPPGMFVAKKPIKLGPIIEPYLEPPMKIDLLYDVEPRPTSSRVMFSRSAFWSQLSLKNVEIED